MHLGFLTSEYPHPKATNSAGIGTSIYSLASQLSLKGAAVSIFIYDQENDEIIKDGNITLHFIKRKKYKVLGWFLYRKFLQNYLNKYIIKDSIDIVEAPDWTGITAFMHLKCPIIIRIHGSDTYFCHLEKRAQKIKNFIFEKTAIKSADYIISVSAFAAEISKKLFDLKKEVLVIPNLVDLEKFQPDPGALIPNRLLYFGSIIRKKGVLELASIFNLVHKQEKKARLVMVGKDVKDHKTGRSTMSIFNEKLSEDARENVDWLGKLEYDIVRDEIKKANVILLPSLAEALPMTWLESMAMEKALVTSNIGWANELMVNDITGFMVDPKEHRKYAEKILLLLKNNMMAQNMGMEGRKKINEDFSTENLTAKNLRFYKDILLKY